MMSNVIRHTNTTSKETDCNLLSHKENDYQIQMLKTRYVKNEIKHTIPLTGSNDQCLSLVSALLLDRWTIVYRDIHLAAR